MTGDVSIPPLRNLPPGRLAERTEHLVFEVTREPGSRGAFGLGRGRLVALAAAILLGGLLVAPALGIGDRILDLIQGAPAQPEVQSPVWSPDGRRIAFVSRRDGKALYVMNADGSGLRIVARVNQLAAPAWSPDGRKLAFLFEGDCGQFCFHLYVLNADGSGLRDLTRKLAGVRRFGAGPASDPVWSPDGRKIAFVRLNTRLGVYVVNVDGSGVRNLTPKSRGAAYAAPAWSPDGRKIAFAGARDGNSEIYLMNADGSGQGNLTRNLAYDGDPGWSPDGQKITFVSNRDGLYEVYVMNSDGSGQRRLT